MTTVTTKTNTRQSTSDVIIVKATYTVKTEFAAQNQENIKSFISDLKKVKGLRYEIFLGDDGQTFHHLAVSESADVQREFLALPSFLHFQKERDKNLVGEPKLESIKSVANTF